MVVKNWIAQMLAKYNDAKFIHLSYSDELALDNSSCIREIIKSDEYQNFWGLQTKDDSDSKKKWYTTKGGGVYATSSGGAITGFGAGRTSGMKFGGAIVIDDPLKPDDADSETVRRRTNERLNSTIKSRRNSRNTPLIIIMQRLHENDMSGFVLENGMGEKFHHLKLPAIMPDGEPLWEFKHNKQELDAMKVADPYGFSGQYMQEPSPVDGEFFKRHWFKRFELGEEPSSLSRYGASDYAVSKNDGDWTEQGVAGYDEKENLYLIDWWSGKETTDVWIDQQLEMVKDHDPYCWVTEGGIIRKAVEPFIKKAMEQKGTYFIQEWLNSNKDKIANARGFQALAAQGKVHIPNTPWGEDLITQLLQFPNGKHDDKVDVCGLFGRILDQMYSPRNDGYKPTEKTVDAWGHSSYEEEEDWRVT